MNKRRKGKWREKWGREERERGGKDERRKKGEGEEQGMEWDGKLYNLFVY